MSRRLTLLSVLLVLVCAVSAAGAVAAEVPPAARPAIGAPSPITPVLSARRVPGLLAAPVADRRLVAALDLFVASTPPDDSTCLTVAASGRELYAHSPLVPLVPASVQKLVTAVAALEVLGPDHRFETVVRALAAPVDGVVAGDLFLVGSGDPLLSTAPYAARFENQPQITTSMEVLADAIVAAGVTRIDGAVLGDETRYDADRYPDSWPARFVDQDQSGPLTALTVNDAWIAFPPNPDTRTPDEEPAPDPPGHAARTLTDLLVARGVVVAGAPGAGVAPAGAVDVASVQSPPVADIVTELLRESDNQTGELLLKELAVARGRPGTTADGAEVAADVLAALGLPVTDTRVADGSGLSQDNLLTCRLVQTILDRAGPDSPLAASLAVAGTNGTLRRRFVDTPVQGRLRAKTGTLNEVTALAGFLDTPTGGRLSFALLVNTAPGTRVGEDDLARQTALALILDTYPEGVDLAALGPRAP